MTAPADDGAGGRWRTIESAPKDGTHVLLGGLGWTCPGWFDTEKDSWWEWGEHWTDSYSSELEPTHWQELPPPPQGESV